MLHRRLAITLEEAAQGSRVEWGAPDGMRRGVAAGIDDSGALLVRTASGVERIVGGEVQWG